VYLLIPDRHPLNASGQVNILEECVIADTEEDLVIGLDIKQSATDDAGSVPADVAQRYEARTARRQMDAGGNSRRQSLSQGTSAIHALHFIFRMLQQHRLNPS
jgi:hypothetical protein